MIDRPIVDSWPFVEKCFAPDLLEQLRSLPRPAGEELLGLVRDLAKNHHPADRRVGVLVAPSAPHRCTDDFLKACRALADELELPTIIHALETRLQAITAEEFYGRSMIEYLDDIGFLAPNTSLIHAVWLTCVIERSSPIPARRFSTTHSAIRSLGRGFSISEHSRKQA